MLRGWPFAITLFVAALSVGLIADNPRYVFAFGAFAVFGFLVIGFLLFPRLRATIPFQLGPIGGLSENREPLLLAGLAVEPSAFPRYFVCVLALKSRWVLVLLGVMSFCAFCFLSSRIPVLHFAERHFFEGIYLPALSTMAGLWLSMKWYSEQSLLAKSVVTLGVVTRIHTMSSYRHITYEFRDAEGSYFGGFERDFLGRAVDHMVFVIYDRSNPDNSYSSRGFLFRDFRVSSLRRSTTG